MDTTAVRNEMAEGIVKVWVNGFPNKKATPLQVEIPWGRDVNRTPKMACMQTPFTSDMLILTDVCQ